MAVCYNGNGKIRTTNKEFVNKFRELMKKYEGSKNITYDYCDYGALIMFDNYARMKFIVECKQLIENNIDNIIDGRLWFKCGDEDGSPDNPFPCVIMFEIVNGKLYEEAINTHLPYDWDWRL